MQIDLRVPLFAPIPEVAVFARRCEEAGIDGVGFIDSQMVTRDAFVAIAAAAMAISRIRLMPAVTNPLTQHVSVLASTALSLEDLAPGWVEIWMGRVDDGRVPAHLAGVQRSPPCRLPPRPRAGLPLAPTR